ncbi:restriction endonuclease subunit S [Micromonospora matsumotoense]|uniref:restriction endonuclease subunit S n=1 Tax=Micromonospora matsumotoense TaxID=121616 RepID=UPI0033D7832A
MPDIEATFDELIRDGVLEIGDGYRAKNSELNGRGLPFMRAGNLTKSGWNWDDLERFESGLTSNLASKVSHPGDTVITTKGNSVGRSGYVDSDAPQFVYSPHLSYWRAKQRERLVPRFLRYWAMSPEFLNQLRALGHGTDMAPYLSLSDQRRLRVTLPKTGTQEAIGDLLGALDDKIAVNDRIAATADQYCAAVFEEVVVKESNGITELGEVAIVNAKSVKPTPGGSLRYVDIASVSDGRLTWPERTSWDDAPGRARRGIAIGDTIWSTVRPNRRSRFLVLDEDPLLVASTGFAVITPRNVGRAFLYESARREEFVAYLESVAEGSAYPAVRAEKFLTAPIPDASDEHRDRFEELAFPVRLRAHSAAQESRVLAELRDALLPELMTGRLRVKHAEKVVEEAV